MDNDVGQRGARSAEVRKRAVRIVIGEEGVGQSFGVISLAAKEPQGIGRECCGLG